MTSMNNIEEFSKRLATEYRPQRIVLFGSYARGAQTCDSDVDMLVIMPFEGKSVNKSVEIRLRLRPDFPLDLLVRTPDAVRERLDMGDSFMRDILKSGRVLYEASQP